MGMTKERLKRYQFLKRELIRIDKKLDNLDQRRTEIPVVIGKVTGSMQEVHIYLQKVRERKNYQDILRRGKMQELEKIIEEIELEKKRCSLSQDCSNEYAVTEISLLEKIEKIIRKHMNDGWIPVEERLPEKNEYFADTSSDREFPNGYYRRLEIAYMTDTVEYTHGYYDGYKWMDKWYGIIKNVVAWKIHGPYRPERSEE